MTYIESKTISATGTVIAPDDPATVVYEVRAAAATAQITLQDGAGNDVLNVASHSFAAPAPPLEFTIPEAARVSFGGAALGADVIENGAFAADSNWTKGTGWTIASGVASSDGSQAGNSDLSQTTLTVGKYYKVVFTVSNRSAGTVRSRAGTNNGDSRDSNGTYTDYIKCEGTGTAAIRADADFVGDVDNVSFQEVDSGRELRCTSRTGNWILHTYQS